MQKVLPKALSESQITKERDWDHKSDEKTEKEVLCGAFTLKIMKTFYNQHIDGSLLGAGCSESDENYMKIWVNSSTLMHMWPSFTKFSSFA